MNTHQPVIRLRAMEPDDVDAIYRWENDASLWIHSASHQPFSRHALQQFIDNAATSDIYATRQLRLMAVDDHNEAIGCIDLFDFDPYHRHCALGMIIDKRHRGKGLGKLILSELEFFAREHLQLHLLYCDIASTNAPCIRLFTNDGFRQCGTREEWIWHNGTWNDALIFQKIIE